MRAGDLDDAVARRGECRLGDEESHVVCRDRLKHYGRKPDFHSRHGPIGDTAEEFEKLRRADNGVRNAGGGDQLFLGELGAKITVVGAVDGDDGERDMVADTGCGFRRQKVALEGCPMILTAAGNNSFRYAFATLR